VGRVELLLRLRRTIERRVAKPLARRILAGEFAEGDTALVDHAQTGGRLPADGEYAFEKKKAPAKAAAKAAS